MNKKPLIISTDPGIDDAVCLTIALFAKELDVKLIVPTWGNVSLEKTLNNTLRLQAFLGTKVPVVAGAKLPLVKEAIDASAICQRVDSVYDFTCFRRHERFAVDMLDHALYLEGQRKAGNNEDIRSFHFNGFFQDFQNFHRFISCL